MKKYIYTLIFLVPSVLIGQLSMHTYVEVQEQNADEFEKREKLYWSKVAEKNIDEGVLVAWGLLKQVGVFGGAANYVHVNVYADFETLQNHHDIWVPEKAGFKKEDISLQGLRKVISSSVWMEHARVDGSAKFTRHNYRTPKSITTWTEDNKNIWKNWMQERVNSDELPVVNWGVHTLVYPYGQYSGFTAFTRDGFNSLADAYSSMQYWTFFRESENIMKDLPKEATNKVDNPIDFGLTVIYEVIDWRQ